MRQNSTGISSGLDAYIGALVFLWWFIWRHNHRVFPVQHRRWDRSFMCRRCGTTIQVAGYANANG